jgi:hypothetical protein
LKKSSKKASKSSSKAKPAKKANVKKLPRQASIPGMEDKAISAIENAALDYAEIRDERQDLSKQEGELKQKLMDLMHKANKTEYKRNGIRVWIEVKEETVKVRVKQDGGEDKDDEEEETPAAAPAQEVVNVETKTEEAPF